MNKARHNNVPRMGRSYGSLGRYLSVFGESLVGIAIQPALTGLSGGNHGMSARMCVFTGVLIGRAVAAEDDAAFLTRSKVNPRRANFHAFLTFGTFRLLDRSHRIDVWAVFRHLVFFVRLFW